MENSHKDYTTISRNMQEPFRIDPEFENKIPKISVEEFEQLEGNILLAGEVFDPLVVWDEENILVDGHNRWKIIQNNPGITYKVRRASFSDKWAAFEWMYKNQLGRRNLTDEQRTYMIGKMYEARKNTYGGDRKSSSQNANLKQDGRAPRMDEIIGEELGVNHSTVSRSYKFSKGVDALREVSPEAAEKVLNGKAKATKANIQEIGNADREDVENAAEAILNEMSISPLATAKKVTKVRVKTPEDMENLQKIEAIVNDMYDPTTAPEFTIDLLIDDIEVNAEIYVELLANTLKDRQALVTDENKPRIVAAINKVVENIKKVRDLI